MKKIIVSSFVCLMFQLSLAQEAGQVGTLLQNNSKESNTITGSSQTVDQRKGKSGTRNYDRPSRGNASQSSNYQWKYPYQMNYSEVFLRIPENGQFTVRINDQSISNSNGYFRFFDLIPSNAIIEIFQFNRLVYRSQLPVRPNNRLVLDFFLNKGLYLLGTYPTSPNNSGYTWGDIWSNPYEGYTPPPREQNGYPSYPDTYPSMQYDVMSQREFNNFYADYKNQSFDDNKLLFIQQQIRNTSFTTNQISLLIKELSFSKNQLDLVKQLYPGCVDKRNYYRLQNDFKFASDKREFLEFLNSQSY